MYVSKMEMCTNNQMVCAALNQSIENFQKFLVKKVGPSVCESNAPSLIKIGPVVSENTDAQAKIQPYFIYIVDNGSGTLKKGCKTPKRI